MPRPSPLTRNTVELIIKPLSAMAARRIANALGLGALPDYPADLIACMIATHRAGRKRSKGHTPAQKAAALRCIESRLRRGQDGPELTREITDPHFDMDFETFTRLAPIVANPDVPCDRKLALIAVRRSEIEAMPKIDARHALRVELVGEALARIWYWYAVDRDDTYRQWQFVLAILEAAGELAAGVYKNPKRLNLIAGEVGRLLHLTSQAAGSGS
jgi:hypothetical protein